MLRCADSASTTGAGLSSLCLHGPAPEHPRLPSPLGGNRLPTRTSGPPRRQGRWPDCPADQFFDAVNRIVHEMADRSPSRHRDTIGRFKGALCCNRRESPHVSADLSGRSDRTTDSRDCHGSNFRANIANSGQRRHDRPRQQLDDTGDNVSRNIQRRLGVRERSRSHRSGRLPLDCHAHILQTGQAPREGRDHELSRPSSGRQPLVELSSYVHARTGDTGGATALGLPKLEGGRIGLAAFDSRAPYDREEGAR